MDPGDSNKAGTLASLERLSADLDALNSSFPETKRFLASRGVAKVSDLDARGKEELVEHLKSTLARLTQTA